MSEGIQITIPDFEDDDYNTSTIPFGRSAGGFGGASAGFGSASAGFGSASSGFGSAGFGGSGFGSAGAGAAGFGGGGSFGGYTSSGQDSPILTPLTERSAGPFGSAHNRGDSVTSIDSANSIGAPSSRYTNNPNRSNTSFGHSSQSSIAAPVKKTSFASIRNAFKSSGKNSEPAPPLPSLEHAMKSPFNRSTSSLTPGVGSPLLTSRQFTGGNAPIGSPPAFNFGRQPPDTRPRDRGTKKSQGHSYAKSYHSQNGSFSSDIQPFAFANGASPPPVPRVPNGYINGDRSETPEVEEDKVIMDPKTPSDYALHAVFMRFASISETKIEAFLKLPLDKEPGLEKHFGSGVDETLDELLTSLGQIAQKHTKPVVDSIMRWRRSQVENVGSDLIRFHMTPTPAGGRPPTASSAAVRPPDVPGLLNERKSLVAIYIMCRALLTVLKSISGGALGEAMGHSLEKTFFDPFRRPDFKMLEKSANHRTNAELYGVLIGALANVRFVSVTDRFLTELGPLAHGQVPKDLDMKYENLVKGLKHIQIKVWPPEAFEEGAEFLESLSKSFAHAHGVRLKLAFGDALVHLLHPIGKTAQAETNNPLWAKAIDLIYPKAREMMQKPRYWPVAFPLVITSLCVAPEAVFRKNWVGFFELALGKLKEKALRTTILNGLLRLLWTYLYRCQDSASTTTAKLDSLAKHFFPPGRLGIFPQEDHLEPFIYMTHFILSRHFDHGKELCLELMQESNVKSVHDSGGNVANVLSPERTSIAIQAILLSLHLMEKDQNTPTWPSGCDFSVVPSWQDYPTSSDAVPPSFLSKPGMQEFFDRCGTVLGIIAKTCAQNVGNMSMLDEQYAHSKLNVSYEEASSNYIVRRHPEVGNVAYSNTCVPQISMLQTCFQAWPRCLHPSLPLSDAVDMLLRGVVHVEPLVGDVASAALRRFMALPSQSLVVLARFNHFLFGRAPQEGAGVKLLAECTQLLELWVKVVDEWVQGLLKQTQETLEEDDRLLVSRCGEIEAGVLFLLSHESRKIYAQGVVVARKMGALLTHLTPTDFSPSEVPQGIMPFIDQLHHHAPDSPYLKGFDDLLEKPELARLAQWRVSKRPDVPLRIADSDNEKDRKLWRFIYPQFLQSSMDASGQQALSTFRDVLVAAASRYQPTISHLAGLSSRVPVNLAGSTRGVERDGQKLVRANKPLIDQWYVWVKILCSTATLPDSSRPPLTQLGRDHSRAASDTSFERERFTTTRGLFRYLTPFLDSEYTLFRDAAVLCISAFPSSAYPHLLEDLSLLAGRQFYDDPRSKVGTPGLPVVVEQNLNMLSGRQDDARFKAMSSVVEERTRRQERLHSAVARIYCLTAHLLQNQRGPGRQAALANVLKFVRNTQTFLTSPESRENHTLQRLRRYFCGTVERLFDGLSTLEGSDRFIPSQMHLTLYRLCEEWCQFGTQPEHVKQRLVMMQKAASSGLPQSEANETVERFQNETLLLSYASIGALASLCQKAFSPPGVSSGSPTERQSPEDIKPLSSSSVLDRLSAISMSAHEQTQTRGKKALRGLLLHNLDDKTLMDEALRRSVVIGTEASSSNRRFFEVVSDIIFSGDNNNHGFSFAQVVALGLANLCHPLMPTRRQAFDMLEAIHQQASGILTMSQFEPTVVSLASGTYVHAHRQVSDFLAGEHPEHAAEILAQLASWLPQLPAAATSNPMVLLLLQSLEFWIPNIQLLKEDKSGLSVEGHAVLFHLMTLSLQYGQSHTEQILVLWTRLIDPPNESNGHATVRFLLEQSHKVGTTAFIDCATNIVACLCHTAIGPQIFEDLCSVIEPARMLPTIDHRLAFPEPHDLELWSDLDALFADDHQRLALGSAQFAWLFLADVALQRYWELKVQLPLLLHATFTHLDHRSPYVRDRAKRMLFLLLRSWAPGYDELPERSALRNRHGLKSVISAFEKDIEEMYWTEEEKNPDSKMRWLCTQVISFFEPLCPALRDRWGSLALNWGTSCSIRPIAFRSLQIFRALSPKVKKNDLALLLGRLSNTISAPDVNIQSFTTEILLTVNALASSDDLDLALLPQMFWGAVACLGTTVEAEFAQAVALFESLLPWIDFDDENLAERILVARPEEWKGTSSLQYSLRHGLRSSVTAPATMKILHALASFSDGRLICPEDGRIRDLYTLSLPWCLYAMSTDGPVDEELRLFAENIGKLAKMEGRHSIHKIMTSFAKSIFRTRDDFLRQSVSSLREHYGTDTNNWTEIVTLLMGLVLNSDRWLRIHAMQILKLLFQQRETRNPVELLGSELLMPLLRLLETDLATQALDVLEEEMTMSGGLAAKHVLRMSRMSMHARVRPMVKDVDATVFGVPEDSGWCVVKADELRETCRFNVMAVFDTCAFSSRPSQIEFEPEMEALAEMIQRDPVAARQSDLGGLVQNLHDLTSFFQDEEEPGPGTQRLPPNGLPSRRLEARVAAILAKSTAADTTVEMESDIPPTPFVDVFRVSTMIPESDDESDSASDADSEYDAFIFDSSSEYRSAPNGTRLPTEIS